jgi:hypothetical protein
LSGGDWILTPEHYVSRHRGGGEEEKKRKREEEKKRKKGRAVGLSLVGLYLG